MRRGLFIIGGLTPFYWLRFTIFNLPTNGLEVIIWISAALVFSQIIVSGQSSRLTSVLSDLRRCGILLPIGCLLAGSLIGVIISPQYLDGLGILKSWTLTPLLLFVTGLLTLRTVHDVWWGPIRGVITGGVIAALLGLIQWSYRVPQLPEQSLLLPYQRLDFESYRDYLITGRMFGPFESPIYMAMVVVPALLLCLVDLIAHYHKWRGWYFLVSLIEGLLLIVALLLTGSIGGGIGLIFGCVVLACLGLIKVGGISAKQVMLICCAIGVMGLLIGMPVLERVTKNNQRVQSSLVLRREIWRISGSIAKEHALFGVGLGNFQSFFQQWTANRPDFPAYIRGLAVFPHSLFLTTLLNIGLLGFIGFLLLFIRICNLSIVLFPTYPSPVSASLSALSAILAHGMVDTTYWKADLSVLFWLLVMIIVGCMIISPPGKVTNRQLE